VFFSFKYADLRQALVVRSNRFIADDEKRGFIESGDFNDLERSGDPAIRAWVDRQLRDTTVTVVLVGASTDESRWVGYELEESLRRRNGIITVDISSIPDPCKPPATACALRVKRAPHYRWDADNGEFNLGHWIDAADPCRQSAAGWSSDGPPGVPPGRG
jgi:hypothetical protein